MEVKEEGRFCDPSSLRLFSLRFSLRREKRSPRRDAGRDDCHAKKCGDFFLGSLSLASLASSLIPLRGTQEPMKGAARAASCRDEGIAAHRDGAQHKVCATKTPGASPRPTSVIWISGRRGRRPLHGAVVSFGLVGRDDSARRLSLSTTAQGTPKRTNMWAAMPSSRQVCHVYRRSSAGA